MSHKPSVAIAVGWKVSRLRGLSTLLGCPVSWRFGAGAHAGEKVALAWGRRPSSRAAARFAARHQLPLWNLEDGFLRSIGLGRVAPPLSLVVDPLGIYYDATQPSQLERLIHQSLSLEESARARALRASWCQNRVSKYNHSRDYTGKLPERYVLVADQTRGDVSIGLGLASPASFTQMLASALVDYPDCIALLKVHPEVWAGRKRGHFNLEELRTNPKVQILGEDCHPASLIERAEAVFTVTSQVGFEGVLWGKPVHTFGAPFYAGWGLTKDALDFPNSVRERRSQVTLEQLVHAALVRYPRYLDPETGSRCEPERLLEWMGLQRRMRERFPAALFACGFSSWKKPFVRSYFQGSRVQFLKNAEETPPGGVLAVWGRKYDDVPLAASVRRIRLEDGFLRSVGLGADLVRPLSWVMDRRGIYYDSAVESDLEHLLQTASFSPELRLRAADLRERLVRLGVTKYNVGLQEWRRPAGKPRVILVVGQVESDASIRHGAPEIRTNLGLLQAVRKNNPEAYVLYKPHPDVVAGLRLAGQGENEATHFCDELLVEAAMGDLLTKVDEVHLLTSLTGFEALLRGKKVTCYGQPFYSGWGLTTDICPHPRRTRSLLLDELVAGALILYPTYISGTSGAFSTPERALDELVVWRKKGASTLPLWRKVLRWFLRLRAR